MKNMTLVQLCAAVAENCGDFLGEARCMRVRPDGTIFHADETDTDKLMLSEVLGVDVRAAYVHSDGRAGLAIFGSVDAAKFMPLVEELKKNAGKYGAFKIWRTSAKRTSTVTLITTEGVRVLSTAKHTDEDLAFDNGGNPNLEAYDEKGNLVTLV